MHTVQLFTKCIHELPHYDGLFWVKTKYGEKTVANYNTRTNSFDVRGVIEWCNIDD